MAESPRRTASPRDLQARIAVLEEEQRRLQDELGALRDSTSYRLGHALVRTAARLDPRRRTNSRRAARRAREATRPSAAAERRPAPAPSAAGERRPAPAPSADDDVPAPSAEQDRPATSATSAPSGPASVARQGPGGAARTTSAARGLASPVTGGRGTSTAAGRAGSPAAGPTGPEARLLDATGVDTDAAVAAARLLRGEGHRLTVVHPHQLPVADDGLETIVADRAEPELLARFGPARTLRAAPGSRPPTLLVRDAQPLELVVDEPGDTEGLPDGPVFVGGTGRSGTWVIGRMLAQHPRFACVHTELRFHSSPPGFAAVLAGELAPDDYAELVRRRWFRPAGGSGAAKGLQLLVGNRELRRMLRDFRQRAADDVPGALGQLMLDVTAPFARGRGALRWAETTPDNAQAAAALTTVLPSAHVVHAVRDGRDAAASVVTMPWGPATYLDALDWWARRLREAHRGMAAADPRRVHTVRLEELIHLDRDRTLGALLNQLGFTDDERLRDYFASEMTSEQGHVGRWRRQLDVDERDAFDGRYRELYAELADEGVTCLPPESAAVDELADD